MRGEQSAQHTHIHKRTRTHTITHSHKRLGTSRSFMKLFNKSTAASMFQIIARLTVRSKFSDFKVSGLKIESKNPHSLLLLFNLFIIALYFSLMCACTRVSFSCAHAHPGGSEIDLMVAFPCTLLLLLLHHLYRPSPPTSFPI